jgi:hypothetical protein
VADDPMKGRRLPDLDYGRIHADVQAGDYWRVTSEGEPLLSTDPGNLTGGIWYVAAPMSYGYAIGRLTKHTVREHEDGTISVRPDDGSSNSILLTGHGGEKYHGFIEHGEWT